MAEKEAERGQMSDLKHTWTIGRDITWECGSFKWTAWNLTVW